MRSKRVKSEWQQEKRWPYGQFRVPITQDKNSGAPGTAHEQKNRKSKAKQQSNNTERFVNLDNLLRGKAGAHSKDIICGDLAMHLDLIATGGRDRKVKIWDYERIQS
jgi:hypothetical protein